MGFSFVILPAFAYHLGVFESWWQTIQGQLMLHIPIEAVKEAGKYLKYVVAEKSNLLR
jgi:hypothetical protein